MLGTYIAGTPHRGARRAQTRVSSPPHPRLPTPALPLLLRLPRPSLFCCAILTDLMLLRRATSETAERGGEEAGRVLGRRSVQRAVGAWGSRIHRFSQGASTGSCSVCVHA